MTWITILNTVGGVCFVLFFLYIVYWKTKSLGESFTEGKESAAVDSFGRSCDKYSWLLFIAGILCFVAADYLSGKGTFFSLLKEFIVGS